MSEIDHIYLVRGARLACQCGSHVRSLNQPKCHGVYATGHPMIHELDCNVGDTEHITFFGVCVSSTPPPGAPTVTYKKVAYDDYGEIAETEEDLGVITGPKCMPDIIGKKWNDTWILTRIVDNGNKDPIDAEKDKDDATKGYPAATVASYLLCKYAEPYYEKIFPITSGQEDRSAED